MPLVDSCSISKWLKRTSLLFFLAGAISGCQKKHTAESVSLVNPSISTTSGTVTSSTNTTELQPANTNAVNDSEGGIASNCERELLALSKVNQNAYAQMKSAFDTLLKSASVYTEVRDEIGAETRGTMDSLYKYKTQKLCSDIQQSVRESLISNGEKFK